MTTQDTKSKIDVKIITGMLLYPETQSISSFSRDDSLNMQDTLFSDV